MIDGCKRQKIKHGKFEQLEQTLFDWFSHARALNLSVNDSIVTENAHKNAERLRIDHFAGFGGRIDRFKTRHGIVCRQIWGLAKSVNNDDVIAWSEKNLTYFKI